MPRETKRKMANRFYSLLAGVTLLLTSCSGNQDEQKFTDNGSGSSTNSIGAGNLPPPPVSTSPPPASSPPAISKTTPSRPKTPVQATPLPSYYYEWKENEFRRFNEFTNRCVFPMHVFDKRGTVLDELFAVRKFVRDYYRYWHEVKDIDPRPYAKNFDNFDDHYEYMTNKDSYFQKLGLFEERLVGELSKDKYKSSTMEEFYKNIQIKDGDYPTFGINWEIVSQDVPRDYRVRYTNIGSPASELANGTAKVKRGDKLLKVNGYDFVNSTNAKEVESMFDALAPASSVNVTKLVFYDHSTKSEKTVMLQAKSFFERIVQSSKIINTANGKVGYFHVGEIGSNAASYNSIMEEFKNKKVKDVVIDIRYFNEQEERMDSGKNESALAYMIAGEERTNASLRNKEYRGLNNAIVYNDEKQAFTRTKPALQFSVPFYSYCFTPGPSVRGLITCNQYDDWEITRRLGHNFALTIKKFSSLELDRVFFLVSKSTCNKAETLINALRGVGVEVILIGDRTCGNPFVVARIFNCGIIYRMINARFANEKSFDVYDDGFKPANSTDKKGVSVPGCYVKDDLTKPLGSEEEPLLAGALQYIKDKTCPPVQ